MERSSGHEEVQYTQWGYEEEQIRNSIRHQEQLDAKGYDDDGKKKITIKPMMMVSSNNVQELATPGVASNRQAPRFAATV